MTNLERVKQNGPSVYYIKNPTLEVQLEAVKQDGWSIDYIKNPTLEVQLEALRKSPELKDYYKINKKLKQTHPEFWF